MPWTDRDWVDRHALFKDLPVELRERLPSDLRHFTYKPQGSLAQVYYQDPKVHYEVWFHWRSGRLELGLHFERDERSNGRLFDRYDRHIIEIKALLGESVELERWDRGWARIYETWPCEKVDRAFREQIIERLSRLIQVLESFGDRYQSATLPSDS